MRLPDPETWNRIRPLLDGLLELDGAGRALRLDQLRAGGEPLAAELQSFISAGNEAGAAGFLEGSADPLGADVEDLVGMRIGAYRITARLGEGGSASVWQADREDRESPHSVAVKLLHPSLVGRAGERRFEGECRLLSRLAHRHIARLVDSGRAPWGQPYLMLELVRGDRIDRYCRARRLPAAARLRLFMDLLSAVRHVHMHGVVHCDIKPRNVLVRSDGTVKLVDFGIATARPQEADAPLPEGRRLRALTPRYGAPEQADGGPVTPATDVHALGVLLRELLKREASCIEEILDRATRVRPTERYATIASLQHDLQHALASWLPRGGLCA